MEKSAEELNTAINTIREHCHSVFCNKNDGTTCVLYDKENNSCSLECPPIWWGDIKPEPHHWEPWELEAMKKVDKSFILMSKQITGYVYFSKNENSIPKYIPINFVNLKIGETVNIDEELERNGMHR